MLYTIEFTSPKTGRNKPCKVGSMPSSLEKAFMFTTITILPPLIFDCKPSEMEFVEGTMEFFASSALLPLYNCPSGVTPK